MLSVPAAPVVSAGLALLCVALGRPVLLGVVALPLEVGSPELADTTIVLTMVDGAAELVEFASAEFSGAAAVEVMSTVDWAEPETVIEARGADDVVLFSS